MDSTNTISGIRALRSWTTDQLDQNSRIDQLEYRLGTMENRQRRFRREISSLSQNLDAMLSRLMMEVSEIDPMEAGESFGVDFRYDDEAGEFEDNHSGREAVIAAPELFLSEGEFSVNLPANLGDIFQPYDRNVCMGDSRMEWNMDELPVFDDDLPVFDELPVFDDDLPVFDELPKRDTIIPLIDEMPVYDDEFPVFDELPEKGKTPMYDESFDELAEEDGGRMEYNFICPDPQWEVQGHKFQNSVRLLHLGGIDMVLGVDLYKFQNSVRLLHLGGIGMVLGMDLLRKWEVDKHPHFFIKCGELLLPPSEPPPHQFRDRVLAKMSQDRMNLLAAKHRSKRVGVSDRVVTDFPLMEGKLLLHPSLSSFQDLRQVFLRGKYCHVCINGEEEL